MFLFYKKNKSKPNNPKSLLAPGSTSEWSSQSPTDAPWWPPAPVLHRDFKKILPGGVFPLPLHFQWFSLVWFTCAKFPRIPSSRHSHLSGSALPPAFGAAVAEMQCQLPACGIVHTDHPVVPPLNAHPYEQVKGFLGRRVISCIHH